MLGRFGIDGPTISTFKKTRKLDNENCAIYVHICVEMQ